MSNIIKCHKCNSERIDQYDYDAEFDEDEIIVTYDMQCMDCGKEFEHERIYKKIKERVVGGK